MNRSVSWTKAARVSAGLSALFLVVYGGCNWLSTVRSDIHQFYFSWERGIPFVPLLIPAYLSIDLFFIAAPFLCSSEAELRMFARRIAAAIVIAGICFLLVPFQFAFGRPNAEGILGVIFEWFRGIDAPFNLVPSLHAALLLLLADVYLRHLGGLSRVTTLVWFILIGLSPVLTYQHHVIDIIAGVILATYCFYFFPDSRLVTPVTPNRRVGIYYLAGALSLTIAALLLRGWLLLLLWPGIALAITAFAYFRGGPNIYRKMAGRLPWSTRLVLGPCLLGQYVSLLYYRRRSGRWDVVTPRLWIGGRLTAAEARKLVACQVKAVLDLTAEFSESAPLRELVYQNIPILDLTAPTQEQLSAIVLFIENQARSGIVYVHCKIGFSRTAAAAAAYLLASGQAQSVSEALDTVRRARPAAIIRPEIVRALREFESRCQRSLVSQSTFLLASKPTVFA